MVRTRSGSILENTPVKTKKRTSSSASSTKKNKVKNEGPTENEMSEWASLVAASLEKTTSGLQQDKETRGDSKASSNYVPTSVTSLQSGLVCPNYFNFETKVVPTEKKDSSTTTKTSSSINQKAAIDANSKAATKPVAPPARNDAPAVSKTECAGSKWFNMQSLELTKEVKRDIDVIKLRNYIDPKRFYKSSDIKKKAYPKVFQMGTVIEGPHEFKSSRISKKQRKEALFDEIMSDKKLRNYSKRKFHEIHQASQSGKKKWFKDKTERFQARAIKRMY